jgi:hypothetical protein
MKNVCWVRRTDMNPHISRQNQKIDARNVVI